MLTSNAPSCADTANTARCRAPVLVQAIVGEVRDDGFDAGGRIRGVRSKRASTWLICRHRPSCPASRKASACGVEVLGARFDSSAGVPAFARSVHTAPRAVPYRRGR
ncbi:MAG: hypothetical protein U1F20_09660 [Lysobacterales bacterium]